MDSEFKRVMAPSLSLLTVGALTPASHSVTLEDENTGTLTLNDNPGLVGITVNVDTSKRAYEIASLYRQHGIPVVMGGIHASTNPGEALQHCNAVCIGDAAGPWEKILADHEKGELKSRYTNEAIDKELYLPAPRWELIDRSRYLYTNVISTSCGCPFHCDFCYNSSSYVKGRFRKRPIDSVLREIESLGTSHVLFIDDNFIGDIPWLTTFLASLDGIRIKWSAAVSANIVHHEALLDEMAEKGCQSLFIGFESINRDSIREVHKHQNDVDLYEKLVEALHGRNIMINASLVFGLDNDRPDVFGRTLDWLVRKKISSITVHILTPYPGTRLFQRLEEQGRIVDYDWSHYNTSHVVYRPLKMTEAELAAGYLWIYHEFYSLGNILKRMPPGRAQWMPYLLFNFLYRKYGGPASRIALRMGLMEGVGKMIRKLSYGLD
jgi:radical SAM superfamily enzyme YgiQ (UPF0313 family)